MINRLDKLYDESEQYLKDIKFDTVVPEIQKMGGDYHTLEYKVLWLFIYILLIILI